MRRPSGPLWRNAAFLRLWTGQTISVFGSLVGSPALTFAAVLTLHATPLQVGLLAACRQAPGVIVGLPAGVWVDRLRRRPVLIAADVGRALLMASIPAAAWLGRLRLEQLYLVGFVAGMLTIFFDVAYQSYVPSLVDRELLVDANSALQATESIAETGGFGLAGVLIQLLTAPTAVLVDAVSFAGSALCIAGIRRAEPSPGDASERESVGQELRAGLRYVLRDPMLRTLAGSAVTVWMGFGMVGALIVLFSSRTLGLRPGPLGVIWCVGGLSSLAGAWAARRVTRRLGLGLTLSASIALTGAATVFIPIASGPIAVVVLSLVAQQLFGDFAEEIYSIDHLSLRQAITPEHLRGRVNGAARFLQESALLTGSLVGGALGELAGIRPTLLFACVCLGGSALWFVLSPVGRLRAIPMLETDGPIVRAELS